MLTKHILHLTGLLLMLSGCTAPSHSGAMKSNGSSVLIVNTLQGVNAVWGREFAQTLRERLQRNGLSARVSVSSDPSDVSLYGSPDYIVEISAQPNVVTRTMLRCRITHGKTGSLVWKTTLPVDDESNLFANPMNATAKARLLFHRMKRQGAVRRMKRPVV